MGCPGQLGPRTRDSSTSGCRTALPLDISQGEVPPSPLGPRFGPSELTMPRLSPHNPRECCSVLYLPALISECVWWIKLCREMQPPQLRMGRLKGYVKPTCMNNVSLMKGSQANKCTLKHTSPRCVA